MLHSRLYKLAFGQLSPWTIIINHSDSSEHALQEFFAIVMKTDHRLIWTNLNIHAVSQPFAEQLLATITSSLQVFWMS